MLSLTEKEVEILSKKLEPEQRDKTVDYEKFIRIFLEDQLKTPAGGSSSVGIKVPTKVASTTPTTINRQQWLRNKLLDVGGERRQYRLVAKVLKLFREAAWKGQVKCCAFLVS